MASENLSFLSVRELGDQIRSGVLSPVEVTEFFLDRVEKLGPELNAVVTVTRDRALLEARAAQDEIAAGNYRGPLHGIPYGVKDLVAVERYPTTWGAYPYRDQVFDEDATVVRLLGEAGAVLVAKLAMVELAGGMGYNHPDASFTGPGICPWNRDFWSGGSSSGPGSAVAAGLVPFAIGSETSGSILTPSAFCGVSGLRPTYGRVSRRGAMALCWTLDKLGPMARTADDCGLVLAAIADIDPGDPSSVKRKVFYDQPIKNRDRLRLVVPKGCLEEVQPEVRDNFRAAITVLGEAAVVVEEIDWPDFPWGPAVGTIVGAEGAAAFADLIDRGGLSELTCPRDRYAGYSGMFVFAVDYLQAMRLRRPMREATEQFFEDWDVVVAPTRASVAYPLDKKFGDAYPGISGGPSLIPAGNLTGLPALSVPNGFGENGLPTGLSFMGRPFFDDKLVELANMYQSKTDWHKKTPPGV